MFGAGPLGQHLRDQGPWSPANVDTDRHTREAWPAGLSEGCQLGRGQQGPKSPPPYRSRLPVMALARCAKAFITRLHPLTYAKRRPSLVA